MNQDKAGVESGGECSGHRCVQRPERGKSMKETNRRLVEPMKSCPVSGQWGTGWTRDTPWRWRTKVTGRC